MATILGLHGLYYETATPLTDRATLLAVTPTSEVITLCLTVKNVSPINEVETSRGWTTYCKVVFCGEDPRLLVSGHAYGRNAEKCFDFLTPGVRVIVRTAPTDPDKDLFNSGVAFSIKLNTSSRITCAGLKPAPKKDEVV